MSTGISAWEGYTMAHTAWESAAHALAIIFIPIIALHHSRHHVAQWCCTVHLRAGPCHAQYLYKKTMSSCFYTKL